MFVCFLPPAEHKTDIATRWRSMTDEERLDWHQRARLTEGQKNGGTATTPGATAASPSSPTPGPVAATAAGAASGTPATVEGRDRIVSYAVNLLQSCVSTGAVGELGPIITVAL